MARFDKTILLIGSDAMQIILGTDIVQVDVFRSFVIVHMKNGDTLELYSENGLKSHQYRFETETE